jgi:hypothetical protein
MPSPPFAVIPTPLGTLTSSSAAAANPVTHLNEFDSIGMTWKATGADGDPQWIRGDFGSAKPVDFLAVVSANVNPAASVMQLRLGASQAAVDGTAAYDSGSSLMVQPTISRADGLYLAHFELPSVQTYRWWRIDFSGLAGFQLEISAIVLGQKVTPASWWSAGFEFGVEDMGDIDIGRYGIPEETPGRIMRTLGFQLGWLSEADFETKFRPLVETLGKRRVAFWCFDPTANVYRQARSYFGWLRPPPKARHIATTPDGPRFAKDFEILSMI